ncbi:MAG TPA: substrate-binding domain-containing protein [Kaistiaceae bacterium]|nr:substrate-binding domain-containing protein [Kaistiaceae bacterium]
MALAAAGVLFSGAAEARDQIKIAGSSTVLPYANIVAEAFGEAFSNFKTPIVESGGSSAGLKEFCKGTGEDTIDIANASRAIKDKEVEACKAAGVTEIEEIKIGYDGIVFASDVNGPSFAFTPAQWFAALGAQVLVDGKLVDNPNTKWSQVDAALPEWDIAAYIPGEKHGTREVFEEKVLIAGCEATGALKAMVDGGMDKKDAHKACAKVRKDGKAVDIDGDYTETLSRIDSNRTGIGVFGLAFYENNRDKLKVATMDGVTPSVETIAKGEYPVSRPLFFYVKKAHLDVIPGLREYVEFFISDDMTGPGSPTANYGLVPAPDAEREATRADFAAGKTL